MSDLQQRYGTTPGKKPRRTLIVVATVLATLFLGWLAWVIVERSDPGIEAELVSYDVVDAHQVRIRIDSRIRDDSVRGSCLFRATARDHTIVGELNLTVDQIRGAGGDWIPLTTLNRATTVEKVRCTEK